MPATLRSNAVSVLDLDYYKLTMLQFIWKHYADVPVTFRLHSRKQDLAGMFDPDALRQHCTNYFYRYIDTSEREFLNNLGVFESGFVNDLDRLFREGLSTPQIDRDGVSVSGGWLATSLWETVILSAVSEQYSKHNIKEPSLVKQMYDIGKMHEAGANWADFGTRRRHSYYVQARLVQALAEAGHEDSGFIGTSNVHLARMFGVQPIGTYAHELEMVLRNYHDSEFDTTRDVLTKWQEIYPWQLRVALTDTYTTPKFLEDHGRFLLENDWRGVRLDSGNPMGVGWKITDWLEGRDSAWDIVFSDGLDADTIVDLQDEFGSEEYNVNPVFGWGTGLTNPHSDLSLVMKAVESNGKSTYKITDDNTKSIGN